jgi:hypothetical protein
MKIYFSHSYKLNDLEIFRQKIMSTFPGAEIIEYIKGEPYDAHLSDPCDICVAATHNPPFVSKGVCSELERFSVNLRQSFLFDNEMNMKPVKDIVPNDVTNWQGDYGKVIFSE